MSRPYRLLFPLTCALLSFGLSACVGTVYDRMYSNKKTYYKPPAEKKEVSAEDLLKGVEGAPAPAADMPVPDAGLAMPPAAGDIPGLPPAMPDPAAPAPPPPPPPPPL